MKLSNQFVHVTRSNPYHSQRTGDLFMPSEPEAASDINHAFSHQVDDLVKLELAAEQMVGDEVLLAREYVKDDAGHFWRDLKEGFVNWELAAGQMLLSAADPTRVDWHEHHWWGDDESQFH